MKKLFALLQKGAKLQFGLTSSFLCALPFLLVSSLLRGLSLISASFLCVSPFCVLLLLCASLFPCPWTLLFYALMLLYASLLLCVSPLYASSLFCDSPFLCVSLFLCPSTFCPLLFHYSFVLSCSSMLRCSFAQINIPPFFFFTMC